MTTEPLKEQILTFWLKQDKAETPAARIKWTFALLLVSIGAAVAVFSIPIALAGTFLAEGMVRASVVVLSTCLGFVGYLWICIRPRRWQEEREIEYTADLPDGHVVTLNVRTANGVDYADEELGRFLTRCLSAAIRDWKGHLQSGE